MFLVIFKPIKHPTSSPTNRPKIIIKPQRYGRVHRGVERVVQVGYRGGCASCVSGLEASRDILYGTILDLVWTYCGPIVDLLWTYCEPHVDPCWTNCGTPMK